MKRLISGRTDEHIVLAEDHGQLLIMTIAFMCPFTEDTAQKQLNRISSEIVVSFYELLFLMILKRPDVALLVGWQQKGEPYKAWSYHGLDESLSIATRLYYMFDTFGIDRRKGPDEELLPWRINGALFPNAAVALRHKRFFHGIFEEHRCAALVGQRDSRVWSDIIQEVVERIEPVLPLDNGNSVQELLIVDALLSHCEFIVAPDHDGFGLRFFMRKSEVPQELSGLLSLLDDIGEEMH